MTIKHTQVFASKSNLMRGACEELAASQGWDGELDRCRMCNSVVDGFNDDLSEKEYYISGMCQQCQDSIFGGETS